MAVRHWYKYFPERRWAEAFLDGEVLFRSLAYFRDYEDRTPDAQIVRDDYEGTRVYLPENGLVTHNRATGQIVKFVEPWAFESGVKASEVFVFCVSNSYDNRLMEEFHAEACVEIVNRPGFFDRLRPALPENATFVHGNVRYYSKSDEVKTIWAFPDQIIMSKLRRFAQQDEYRFGFSTTDALKFQKANYRLTGRESRPTPNPSEHLSQKLNLGSLGGICKLRLRRAALKTA